MNIIRIRSMVVGAVAGVGLYAADIDFDATTQGSFISVGVPPADVQVLIQHNTVTATPFTFASLVAAETVLFSTTPWSIVDGVFNFSNDAGELLFGSFSGTLIPDPVNTAKMTVTDAPWTITGGTGQFSALTGGGTLDADITFTTLASGTSTIVWEGTVVPEASPLALLGLGLFGLAIWRRR